MHHAVMACHRTACAPVCFFFFSLTYFICLFIYFPISPHLQITCELINSPPLNQRFPNPRAFVSASQHRAFKVTKESEFRSASASVHKHIRPPKGLHTRACAQTHAGERRQPDMHTHPYGYVHTQTHTYTHDKGHTYFYYGVLFIY